MKHHRRDVELEKEQSYIQGYKHTSGPGPTGPLDPHTPDTILWQTNFSAEPWPIL